MPTLLTVFEREILDLSRAALHLEKLLVCSDSIPSPVRYQRVLKCLSELCWKWEEHRVHQRKLITMLLSKDGQPAPMVDRDEPGFYIEQQLKTVSVSMWPRTVDAGLSSLRVAVPGILKLLYQQIARERATCAPLIHRRKIASAKRPLMLPLESVLKIKRASAQ
jgi:hypothetical protein